jgi:hypothetical protein
MDLVDADRAPDGKQQRTKQHDGRNGFQHAAEDREGHNRPGNEGGRAAGSPVIAAARARENPDWVNPQAMPVAAPMIKRIAPERLAVSINMGISLRQSNWR